MFKKSTTKTQLKHTLKIPEDYKYYIDKMQLLTRCWLLSMKKDLWQNKTAEHVAANMVKYSCN